MSERLETPADGQEAGTQAPLTRREALALERAAGRSAAPKAEPTPRAERHTPRAERHVPRPKTARAPRVSIWHPTRKASTGPTSAKATVESNTTMRWVRGGAGLALVAGLFATVALPAYSMSAEGQAFSASNMFASAQQQAQSVSVNGTAAGQAAGTDSYSSQTKAQLTASQVQSIRTTVSALGPARQADGDDYPFWNQATEYAGGGLSPLGYYYRECVDFVAWRLNRDAGSTSSPFAWTWHNLASGSAYRWYSAWQEHGWTTSSTPVAGAVAWFPYNHVAYVKSVNSDGTVNIEEYNQQSDHLYHNRTIQASDAVYLYPPS